ncbi:Uncharacterised protein [Vibrio cholerae]|nr:Uncharacterised protein [Vibrio cholerae]
MPSEKLHDCVIANLGSGSVRCLYVCVWLRLLFVQST